MYEIFKKLMEGKGVTPYRVAKETGIATATLSDWKNGKSQPKADKLQKIADYFEVTLDYLLGNTDIKKAPSEDEVVSDELIQFALFGGKVDDETYEDVKRFAAFIKAKKEEEKKGKG